MTQLTTDCLTLVVRRFPDAALRRLCLILFDGGDSKW